MPLFRFALSRFDEASDRDDRVRAIPRVSPRVRKQSPQGVSLLADPPISSLRGFVSPENVCGQKSLKLYWGGGKGGRGGLVTNVTKGTPCRPNRATEAVPGVEEGTPELRSPFKILKFSYAELDLLS